MDAMFFFANSNVGGYKGLVSKHLKSAHKHRLDDRYRLMALINKKKPWLVGGFNPSEKYQSNWIISPSRVEHKQSLKPPTSIILK